MRTFSSPFLAVALAGSLLAGCGGQAGAPAGAGAPIIPTAHGTGTARFMIAVPKPSASVSRSDAHAQYVSPATQSITITLSGPTAYHGTANLTVGSSGCTSTLASTTCTLTVPGLAPGTYTATLTTYDGANGTGNVLSTAQSIAFTVTAEESNTVNLTLSGVPASTAVHPVSSFISAASGSNSYDLLGQGARTFLVESLDADGNIIVGPGAPTYTVGTVSGTLSGVTVAAPTTSAPNRFSVTPPTAYGSGTAAFTVTPTFAGQATDGCTQTGANCAAVTVSVAMDPLIYVGNGGNNSVTAYDGNGVQQTLSGTPFPNLNNPKGIAYDPSNGFLYVTNAGNNTVTAYDQNGVQQTLSGTFPNLFSPSGIAYNPGNGFLYVANANNNTVTAYNQNGAQQTLTGTFPNLNNPQGITYDSIDGFLYVANYANNTVTAYDETGAQALTPGNFPALMTPYAIAYDPGNNFLYVGNVVADSVMYYDQNGVPPPFTGPFPYLNNPMGIAYDPSNGFLLVANNTSNTVTAYDQNGNPQTLSGTFPNLNGPTSITVVP